MTTVAASLDFMEIAADSMCSGDDGHYLVEKLKRGKQSAFGAAGEWDKILKFYEAIEKGGELDSECDIEVLELRHDGLWVYEGTIIPARIKNRFYAIGTGAGYAIAAMHLGKSPKEAVQIAALFDPGTGGPIDVITLEKKSNVSKRKAVN
jgi:hypothetical protein